MANSEIHYWAFISYSHADERWARWLHRALEGFRVPRRLIGQHTEVGPVPRRLYPVFRDREELASASELSAEIEAALEAASSLLVICSPAAARSRWVANEIRHFQQLGRARRIFCLIVDGDPEDDEQPCFPASLKSVTAEPIAADLRPGGDGKQEALLKLVAGILGLRLSRLRQRAAQRRQRQLAAVAGGALAAALLTSSLAWYALNARNEAFQQRQLAEQRREQAEGLIGFMLGELRDRLEPIGKLDILDAVGSQALQYYAEVDPAALSDGELVERARALRQIGQVRLEQGRLDSAAQVFREALRLDRAIVDRHPGDTEALFNVGQSQFYVGYDLLLRGDLDGAQGWLEKYASTAARLRELEPDEPRWMLEEAYATDNLATLHSRLGRQRLARQGYLQAKQAYEALLTVAEPDPEHRFALLNIGANLARNASEMRDWSAMQRYADEAIALARAMLHQEPDNQRAQFALANALHHRVHAGLQLAQLRPEDALIQEMLDTTGALVTVDATNIRNYQAHHLSLYYLSVLTAQAGDLSGALAVARRMVKASTSMLERLHETPPEALRFSSAFSHALAACWSWASGQTREAAEWMRLALAEVPGGENLSRQQAQDRLWMLFAARLMGSIPAEVAQDHIQTLFAGRVGWQDSLRPELQFYRALLDGQESELEAIMSRLSPGERVNPFNRALCQRHGCDPGIRENDALVVERSK